MSFDLRSACVGYWKLNENAANSTVADSVGSFTGTLKNSGGSINTSTIATSGKLNGAFSFNGDTNKRYVDLGNILNKRSTDAFSIEAWLNTSVVTRDMTIIGKYDGDVDKQWIFQLTGTGTASKMEFYFANAGNSIGVDGSSNVATGSLVQVFMSYDGSQAASGVKFYFNHVLETNGTPWADNLTDPANTSNILAIGLYKTSVGLSLQNTFDGILDNITFYNREVTQAEVDGRWNNGAGTEDLTDMLGSMTTRSDYWGDL